MVHHWEQAKCILKYLDVTIPSRIAFNGDIFSEVIMWHNSSFANENGRRSRAGYIVGMMCGGNVVWESKLKLTIKLSIVEAEDMTICVAV
jgi:hypothetical protein